MTAAQFDAPPKLKRITRQKSVYLHVVDQIQQSIKAGHLLPGDQLLPERELAEQFGVSRPSIRQALAVLENQGILEITPRDGAYIRQPNLEQVVEPLTQALFWKRGQVAHLFEMRLLIETQAGRLAATRRDAADLERLWAINGRYETELRQEDLAFEANKDFHIAIVEAAKNPLLTEVMTPLLIATMEVYVSARRDSLPKAQNLQTFVHEHRHILEAIEQRDADLTEQLIAKHINDARQRVGMIFAGGSVA